MTKLQTMKTYIKTMAVAMAMAAAPCHTAMAQKTLEILHTNDTHSTILPLNPNLADTLTAGRGGYLRRIAMLRDERAKNPDLLLFDSGDFSQGSPFYTIFKGDVEIELMNRMRYDAATIGNHEFDFGLDNMARLFRKAKFPIVCANYDFSGTPVKGTVKPYTIIKRDGVRIGVFGICPPMDGLVDENKCRGVKFLDPVKTALETASMLKRKKRCDVVICLSHLGWKDNAHNASGAYDQQLIGGSRDIDLVLGGHTHTYFETLQYADNLDGKAVPDDQNGKHAIYVGKILMQLRQQDKAK